MFRQKPAMPQLMGSQRSQQTEQTSKPTLLANRTLRRAASAPKWDGFKKKPLYQTRRQLCEKPLQRSDEQTDRHRLWSATGRGEIPAAVDSKAKALGCSPWLRRFAHIPVYSITRRALRTVCQSFGYSMCTKEPRNVHQTLAAPRADPASAMYASASVKGGGFQTLATFEQLLFVGTPMSNATTKLRQGLLYAPALCSTRHIPTLGNLPQGRASEQIRVRPSRAFRATRLANRGAPHEPHDARARRAPPNFLSHEVEFGVLPVVAGEIHHQKTLLAQKNRRMC